MSDNKPQVKMTLSMRKKAMVQAMQSTLGNVTASCKAVGMTRDTHYQWMKKDPRYRKAIEECEEIDLDFSEAALRKQIQKGNITAIIFHLKTKGKKRGYIETNHTINTDVSASDVQEKSVDELLKILDREV